VTLETLLAATSAAASASQFDLRSIAALDDVLSSDSLRVESEDALLTGLLRPGSAYSRLLRPV
jgi:hypothetical protein